MADPITISAAVGYGVSAVGWLASPIISRVLNKGFSLLDLKVAKRLKNLDTRVLQLHRVMEVVESTYREDLEPLLNKLKSALYEAEDILDSVEYQSLKKQIQDANPQIQDAKLDEIRCKTSLNLLSTMDFLMKKIRSALLCSPVKDKESGLPKVQLGKSLDNIEGAITDACKILDELNLPGVTNDNWRQAVANNARTAVTTSGAPPRVFGRDKDCHKIIAMLHEKEDLCRENSVNDTCYSVIGIHGIAGSGKSTLAQYVFDHETKYKEGHFDLIMWIHVSQKFDLDSMFRNMFEEAAGKKCENFNSRNLLKKNLEDELRGKKILLVLDDVWYSTSNSEDREELEKLISPLNVGKAGSRILVTSRTEAALVTLGAVKERCIPISILDDEVFLEMFMHYALRDATVSEQERRKLVMIGEDIAKKLKRSPLAARTVGSGLRGRPDVVFWRRAKDRNLMNETMGALWWSYQYLDEQVRRCFAYCSIFPRGHRLKRDELVRLWVAEGFINTSNPEEEMEDVAQYYFDELLSASFLQFGGKEKLYQHEREVDYFTIHDLLCDLAEEVSGNDCFRIENGSTGEVPEDVRYLFVETYDREMLTEKISKLQNLRTLIIDDIILVKPTEWEVFASMFTMLMGLQKLRVLKLHVSGHGDSTFSFPDSIGQLKHLRYFTFLVGASTELTLPATFTKLYHVQVIDFGECMSLAFSSGQDMMNLVNLRRVISNANLDFPNIGMLIWLQMLPFFTIRKKQGYEPHQLKHLNKLQDKLQIHGLDNVQSKEEALEVNLAGKEKLTELVLQWDNGSCSSALQAEVLEGLCPPKYLERLSIMQYHGITLPTWMTNKYNGGPKNLEELTFHGWIQKGIAPDLGAFIHLQSLCISICNWNDLPWNMEHLTSLKKLKIEACMNIWSLPTLPKFLEEFTVVSCNHEFMQSCKTTAHPNCQKIEHIPKKTFQIAEGPFGRLVPFC